MCSYNIGVPRPHKGLSVFAVACRGHSQLHGYFKGLWFVQTAYTRLTQSAVFLVVGLAVLLLLRTAHRRFYGKRKEAAGGSVQSAARRSPLKP